MRRGRVAAPVAALAGMVASGCAGDDEAARPVTATTTADRPAAVTETGTGVEETSTADALRFRGRGDTTLPPIRVPRGGTTLRWTNRDAVFSLFDGEGTVVDSVERRGTAFLPAGVHRIDVIASGGWALDIPGGREVRGR